MRSINIISAKGGQGVTSFAIALACYLQTPERIFGMVTQDDSRATAGLGEGDDRLNYEPYAANLWSAGGPMPDGLDVMIRDNCNDEQPLVVVRNDYVALRNTLRRVARLEPMGFVLYHDPTRVLTERDAINALGMPHLGTVTLSDGVARAIDAGMYVSALRNRTKPMLPVLRVCQSVAVHYGLKDLEPVNELV
jgi:hypothetical protein